MGKPAEPRRNTANEMFVDIRNGYLPLLQLMSVDLDGRFYTGLMTTKCLNTAVLMMYLAAGERGLSVAFECNVNRVQEHYQLFPRQKIQGAYLNELATLLREPVAQGKQRRTMHYIMLTDCFLTRPGSKLLFPGHVFVIERAGEHEYHMYQSYINRYDMQGQVRDFAGNTTMRSPEWVARFCADLDHFVHATVWDERCVRFWDFLAHVDTRHFLGHDKSRIYLCTRKLASEDAERNFRAYVRRKLEHVQRDVASGAAHPDRHYGHPRLFEDGVTSASHPVTPYTAAEMLEFLRRLDDKHRKRQQRT